MEAGSLYNLCNTDARLPGENKELILSSDLIQKTLSFTGKGLTLRALASVAAIQIIDNNTMNPESPLLDIESYESVINSLSKVIVTYCCCSNDGDDKFDFQNRLYGFVSPEDEKYPLYIVANVITDYIHSCLKQLTIKYSNKSIVEDSVIQKLSPHIHKHVFNFILKRYIKFKGTIVLPEFEEKHYNASILDALSNNNIETVVYLIDSRFFDISITTLERMIPLLYRVDEPKDIYYLLDLIKHLLEGKNATYNFIPKLKKAFNLGCRNMNEALVKTLCTKFKILPSIPNYCDMVKNGNLFQYFCKEHTTHTIETINSDENNLILTCAITNNNLDDVKWIVENCLIEISVYDTMACLLVCQEKHNKEPLDTSILTRYFQKRYPHTFESLSDCEYQLCLSDIPYHDLYKYQSRGAESDKLFNYMKTVLESKHNNKLVNLLSDSEAISLYEYSLNLQYGIIGGVQDKHLINRSYYKNLGASIYYFIEIECFTDKSEAFKHRKASLVNDQFIFFWKSQDHRKILLEEL